MNTTPTHCVVIDEDEDCWAVKRLRDGKIVATELDTDTATILCDAYNGKATVVLELGDLENALSVPD
jgi:hypothetical protein